MARRLSKEEQQLLETQSLNQWLAEEYERRNRFAGVEGGVTSTASPFEPPAPVEVEEEEASPWPSLAERALSNPLNPFSPLMNREVRDSVLGFGGTLLESAGAITDAIAPDPHPIAMGMDDYERGLTPGLYARSALEHVRDLGGSLAQLGGSVADWAGIPQESLVPVWAGDASGAAQAVRNRQAADIARERAEAGMIGAEDLRQRALPNRIADVLYGAGEALGGAVSPELQAAQQGLGEAIEGGAGSTLRFLASPQGARALTTGILPQTGAYAAQGFGMGALGRSARLPASLSTAASNTTLAYTVAQQNANEVEQGILGLSDEEAILNPVIREEWLRTRDLEGAKAHAARAARQQTIAASVPVAPLYGIDIFSRAGAGVGSRATQTMQSRLGRSLAVEGAGEFAQEAGEALAADFGQVGGGQMAAEDVGQTALAQGMLGAIASAPIAGGMTYGQARSEFGQRADEVEQAAERLEALYAARAAEEQARAAEAEAEAAAPSDDIDVEAGNALLRTVEENAANEAARVALSEVPAMTSGRFTPEAGPVDMEEEARRNELLLALEPENEAEQEAWRLLREMPAGSDLDGRPVRGEGGRFTGERIAPAESVQLRDSRGRLTTQRAGQAPVPSPDVDALTRDSQRLADSLVAEQQAEAETDDAQITRDRQVQEAREFDQREQERGDEAARKRLATARGEHTRNRRAHLAGVREANMHLDPDARAEAIADAAAEWDVDNPRPTLETLPPEAPRAPRRRAAARPAPTQEELAEAGLEAEEAVVAPTEEAVDVEADLRARYGRAQEGGEAPAGRTAAEVLRELAPRVRSGTDRGALEAEALLAGGKLSIVDPEVMATIEGATGSTEGYYDGERMYINAAALPAGDPVGVLFNSVLAHEANHAAASSQNPDAVSKARVLLEDAPRQKLIEQLETSTHATAEAARRAVAARDIDKQTDPARYEDEMVAYAINHAIESGGRSWAPIRGIVSAARRKMKEYTGSDNLNLDDLGYYARATVNALAESEADIAAPGMGREQVSPEVAAMQAEAEQGAQDSGLATAQAMVEGTATRTAENVMLPVELLQTIPGTINESRGPGDGQYDQLLAAVESDGFRQDRPIDVRINHRGEAFIVDGNTRVAVAAERGVSEIPANVQWMNGAENVESPLTPSVVEGSSFEGRAQESPSSEPRATASSGMGPAPLSRHAANFAKDVFTWHGRGGKRMGNLLEHNAGIRDSYYSKALANAYRAEGGIRDLSGRWAAENGVSRSEAATQIRSMLSDRFDLISRLPNLAAREKALSKLVQTYPELSPVRDAVQDVTALTENIITQRMKNPAPLSASEKELYTYLDRNRGAYLTSAYALFQGPAGKDWGKNLARLAHDGFDRLAKDPQARLPSHIKAAYDVYKRALDFVVANDVAINNPEQILAMSDDDVSRAHDLWAPRGESAADLKARMEDEGTFVAEDFKEVLGDRLMEWVDSAVATPAGKAQIENLGKAEINALLKLAPPSGPALRYAKAAGVDDSILRHKKDIPAELEGLFGKMHDIPSLLTLTAIKQGELASRFSLFNDLRAEQSADGTMVAVTAEERAANPGRYGQHSVQLTGDNYGAIQDMFVTPETSGVLNKYNDTFSTLIDTFAELGTTTIITDILDRTGKAAEATLGRANRWYKTMAIPTRIDHAVMNGIGSIATPVMAGGVKRGHIARGLAVAKAQVLQTLDPTNRTGISKPSPEVARDLELATLMGITDNVVLTDIRKHPRKLVNQFVDDMMKAGTVGELRAGAKKWARRGGRGWRAWVETFSLSDTWIRLPIALERMDFLESFYKANGETKTNEQIMQEAAEFSKNATLTPTRIPGAVKGAERWGATMYGSYMWNVPRVLAYGGIHALQSFDMARKATTPEARDIAAWDGIRKTAGMGLAMLALTEGFRRAAHMMMDDDDREMVDHDRAFLMGEAAVGDLVYLGKDEEGHNMYTILSRIDPYGPVLDIIRAIRRTNGVGDSWDTIVDGASELSIRSAMLPHVAKIFSHAFGEEEVFYRPSRLERMFPELVSKAKNATADVLGMVGRERGRGYRDAEAVLETLSMLIPAGVANRFDSLNPSVSEQDAKIMSESIAVMEALGHKFVVVRPEAAIKGAAFDLRDLHTDSRRQIQQTLRASGPQAAVSTYARQAEEERALVERLGKMYDAAVAKGNSPRAVQDFMKEARLDATTIRNISQGLYATESNDWAVEHSAVLSKALRDRPPADLSEEELAGWNTKVDEMIELIDVMGIKEKK